MPTVPTLPTMPTSLFCFLFKRSALLPKWQFLQRRLLSWTSVMTLQATAIDVAPWLASLAALQRHDITKAFTMSCHSTARVLMVHPGIRRSPSLSPSFSEWKQGCLLGELRLSNSMEQKLGHGLLSPLSLDTASKSQTMRDAWSVARAA